MLIHSMGSSLYLFLSSSMFDPHLPSGIIFEGSGVFWLPWLFLGRKERDRDRDSEIERQRERQ
jgi:hypothetical protein